MARSVPYIRTISDTSSWRQDQALNSTIYILREIGPTGYLLKEEGESKKFKVLIGDPHVCTCPTFRKEKDVCKHICWVLLKKFKVPRQNPVTWQRGLVEREINELLRGLMTRQPATRSATSHTTTTTISATVKERPCLEQREIGNEDVCPICQDEFLLKHEPVTYCKFGCGNSVHIKCMKIWAEHQKTIGEPGIKCPMCRQDFGPYDLLKQEYNNSSTRTTRAERLNQHLATTCHKCRISPIQGKCYKCVTCAELFLCQSCFNTDHHTQHAFVFRQKPSQRWRDVERDVGTVLPQAVVRQLMNREINAEDYDLLLELDNQAEPVAAVSVDVPEEFVKSLPYEKIRSPSCRLLQPGVQCRICLRGYEVGQFVRRLECNHRFHVDCIDSWLMHRRPTCPIDGQVVWSPGMQQQQRQRRQQQRQHQQQSRRESRGENSGSTTAERFVLEVPGVGLSVNSSHRSRSANQRVPRAVDGRGALNTLSSQLTMTGKAFTTTRPDWLAVDNRNDVTTISTNQRPFPPSGRRRLAARPMATPPSMTSQTQAEFSPGLLLQRRGSDSSAAERGTIGRGRTPHRLASLRSRSSSLDRAVAPQASTPTQHHGGDDQNQLLRDLAGLYLGQLPPDDHAGRTNALLREKIARPRPLKQKPRPPVESNATVRRCNEEADISLVGFQMQ